MWKPDTPSSSGPVPVSTTESPSAVLGDPHARTLLAQGEPATIGKSLVIRGEITGTDSLIVEGRVEGSIHLDGNRVTVGRNGRANANIHAREVVVMGKVRGTTSRQLTASTSGPRAALWATSPALRMSIEEAHSSRAASTYGNSTTASRQTEARMRGIRLGSASPTPPRDCLGKLPRVQRPQVCGPSHRLIRRPATVGKPWAIASRSPRGQLPEKDAPSRCLGGAIPGGTPAWP